MCRRPLDLFVWPTDWPPARKMWVSRGDNEETHAWVTRSRDRPPPPQVSTVLWEKNCVGGFQKLHLVHSYKIWCRWEKFQSLMEGGWLDVLTVTDRLLIKINEVSVMDFCEQTVVISLVNGIRPWTLVLVAVLVFTVLIGRGYPTWRSPIDWQKNGLGSCLPQVYTTLFFLLYQVGKH